MADKKMYSVSCKEGGAACEFHVCDSDESEVIAVAQDHARRVHNMDVSADQVRAIMKSGEMASCH